MITHVIVKLDAPIEEKYWQDDDIFSNEYYGFGKPLIRCKDCKHLTHTPHKWYCPINRKVVDRDEFCCWAERRDK